VVVVGSVTSQPRNAGIVVENKMQVGVGPAKRDYTLHLKDAELVLWGGSGSRAATHMLRDFQARNASLQVRHPAQRGGNTASSKTVPALLTVEIRERVIELARTVRKISCG